MSLGGKIYWGILMTMSAVCDALGFVLAVLIKVIDTVSFRINFKEFKHRMFVALAQGFDKGIMKTNVTVVLWEPHDHMKLKFKRPTFIDTMYNKAGELCNIKHVYVYCRYDELEEMYELENGNFMVLSYVVLKDHYETGQYYFKSELTPAKLKEDYCRGSSCPNGLSLLAPAAGVVPYQM